ncbi:hypothetical protein [Sulfurimonas sp.]|uniref:hypothetical protein n=1 Tax=Sulfurimonas sp. TaxID=2022749 RepID=UPI002AAF6BA4|nr:hypothetical protein [Sulfurimonas sp.]
MKKIKLINILLLLILCFSISHGFIIKNEQHSDALEYVSEFSHDVHDELNKSCDFHCEFHTSYILTDIFFLKTNHTPTLKVSSITKLYFYHPSESFLKPPIC